MVSYLLASSDTFYLENENVTKLKEHTKKRGDKSKIVNEALKQYFLPKQENEETPKKHTGEVIGVEL